MWPEGARDRTRRAARAGQSLSRLFELELVLRADAPFDQIFDDTLTDTLATGEASW